MINFTLAISILGGLILAAVVAHTAWQSRKSDNALKNRGERKEPSMQGFSGVPEDRLPASIFSHSQFAGAQSSSFGSAAQLSDALEGNTAHSKSLLDPLIDLVVSLPLDDDLLTTHDMPQVAGEQAVAVLHKLPSRQRIGSKPFVVEGLNLRTENWELPRPDERYGMFQAGVQLANRKGALSEIEFSEFVVQVQQFADAVGAACVLPDMREQLARARELDEFASAHDAQLQLTLVPVAPTVSAALAASTVLASSAVDTSLDPVATWTVSQVQAAARRCGLVAGLVAGRMVLPAPSPAASSAAEHGAVAARHAQHYPAPWLTLSYDLQAALDGLEGLDGLGRSDGLKGGLNDVSQATAPPTALHRVHLSLDVPHVTEPQAAFAALCRTAEALCALLQARLVDDDGVAIHPDALQQIGTELGHLCTALAERDLAAGSVQARRLFS